MHTGGSRRSIACFMLSWRVTQCGRYMSQCTRSESMVFNNNNINTSNADEICSTTTYQRGCV
jgi:hypothetical protein